MNEEFQGVKHWSLSKTSEIFDDMYLLRFAADGRGYVQIRNGVRILMVPKDESPSNQESPSRA
jgi:hypothetical protein